MRKEIPPRTVEETLLLATWNIRVSDHCPLWVELRIDFSDPFIAVAGGLARRAATKAKAQTKTVKPAKKKPRKAAKAAKKTSKGKQ